MVSSFSMHGNIYYVLLTLASTLIILPRIFNCLYPSTCHISANAWHGAIKIFANSYKFDTELMTGLVEILWRTNFFVIY
jgi:hypothetical protein